MDPINGGTIVPVGDTVLEVSDHQKIYGKRDIILLGYERGSYWKSWLKPNSGHPALVEPENGAEDPCGLRLEVGCPAQRWSFAANGHFPSGNT